MIAGGAASETNGGEVATRAGWRIVGALLVSAGLLLWFKGLYGELSTDSYSGWSLAVPVESTQSGVARLYDATEKGGIVEEVSVDLKLAGGERHLLRFALPQISLAELRIDPVDVESIFFLGDPILCGPMHRPLDDDQQRVELRRDRAINATAAADGRFTSQGPDPHFYLKVRKGPLTPPHDQIVRYQQFGWLPAGIGAVLGGWVWWWLACGRRIGPLRCQGEALARCLVRCSVAFGLWGITLFFIWPERKLEASLLYAFSLVPMMVTALAAWLVVATGYLADASRHGAALDRIRPWLRWKFLPAWLCAMLLAMLTLHVVVGLDQSTLPQRLSVLGSLATLVALPLAAGLWWRYREAVSVLLIRWMTGLVTVIAVLTLWRLNDYYGPDWNFANRFADACFFPLHRSISGSATCAVVMIVWLALALGRFRLPGLLFAVVVALPLWLWVLLAQSRGVLLASTGTILLLAWHLPGRRTSLVGAVFMLIGAMMYFTPIPNAVSRQLTADQFSSAAMEWCARSGGSLATRAFDGLASVTGAVPSQTATSPASVVIAPAPAPAPAPSTALAVSLKRTDQVRLQIWHTYLRASMKRPLFGHGFGGKQKLLVQGRAETGLEERLLRVSWNPHNVHISYLYFCGILGVVIEGSLLVLIWWRGAFGYWRGEHTSLAAMVFGLLAAFAAVALLFESTLMAYDKESVLLNLPNEYWVIYWMPVLVGSVWVSLCSGRGDEATSSADQAPAGKDS